MEVGSEASDSGVQALDVFLQAAGLEEVVDSVPCCKAWAEAQSARVGGEDILRTFLVAPSSKVGAVPWEKMLEYSGRWYAATRRRDATLRRRRIVCLHDGDGDVDDAKWDTAAGPPIFLYVDRRKHRDPARVPKMARHALVADAAKIWRGAPVFRSACFLRYENEILETLWLPKARVCETQAFSHCIRLENVWLPEVETIASRAFWACARLSTVELPSAKIVGGSAFDACKGLRCVEAPHVQKIEERAFAYCALLAAAVFPRARKVGEHAFHGCEALAQVDMPTVAELGYYALANTQLQHIALPSCEHVGGYALAYNFDLISADLPRVASLEDSAFLDCQSLTTLSLPAARSLGINTFKGCLNLHHLTLPSASFVHDAAFDGCRGLASLAVPAALLDDLLAHHQSSGHHCRITAL